MLTESLNNTLYVWTTEYPSSNDSLETCWNNTISTLKRRRLIGYDSYNAFVKVLSEQKEEILQDRFVVPGLNLLLEDTETMNANDKLAQEKGYTYHEPSDSYRKTIEGQDVFVNRYMINTHTTSFLEKVIDKLEKEAKSLAKTY